MLYVMMGRVLTCRKRVEEGGYNDEEGGCTSIQNEGIVSPKSLANLAVCWSFCFGAQCALEAMQTHTHTHRRGGSFFGDAPPRPKLQKMKWSVFFFVTRAAPFHFL